MPTVETSNSIKSVNEKGEAPKRRIPDPIAAQTAYTSLFTAEFAGRDARFASIAGLYAGFPPILPSEMEKAGLGDACNLNTKEFEAALGDYTDVWNAVNCSSLEWGVVEADHDDPQEAMRRSDYLTKCFNWALQVWEDPPDDGFFNQSGHYILESAIRDMQMGLYSVGCCIFRDPIDFRFKTIPTRKVLVPEGTNITLDNCPTVFIQDQMSAAQLWALRDSPGWKEDMITKLLYYTRGSRILQAQQNQTYAQWVNWTRENESFLLTDFAQIPIVHLYTREFSQKISHAVFSEQLPTQIKGEGENKRRVIGKKDSTEDLGEPAWLYDAPESRWPRNWSQAVVVFSDNVGAEGTYHGAKGYGDKNYDWCNFSNLMFNETANAAIRQNMIMFQSQTENDREKLNQITFGHGTILLPDLNIAQLKVQGDVMSAMGVFDLATRVRNVGNRKFPINERTRTGEAPTATQVTQDVAKEAQFTNLQISFYRATGLDKLMAEMYRRIAQPAKNYPEKHPGGRVAKEFRKRCEAYGIPEEDLLKVRTVRANRDGGSGNMSIDLMKGQQLLAVATPGKGQYNARRYIAATLKGAENADAFVEPPPEAGNELTRLISHENLFIQDGKTPDVLPNDLHDAHLQGHLALANELSQVVTQFMESGVTPDNVEDAILLKGKLDAAIEHSGMHVQFLAQMPRSQGRASLFEQLVKDTQQTLNSLVQLSKGLEQDIQKAVQEKQKASASMNPEVMKAQNEAQVMMIKAQAEIAVKQALADQKIRNSEIAAQAKAERQGQEHQQRLGQQAIENVAALEMERARNAEAMHADGARTVQDMIQTTAQHEQDLEHQRQMSAAEAAAKANKPNGDKK